MLDAWMMTKVVGDIATLRIGLVGDPHCRALRAIITTVAKFAPAEITILAPDPASLPDAQRAQLDRAGTRVTFADSATELLRRVDVVSMIPVELPDFHLATAPARRPSTLHDRFKFSRRLIERHGKDVVILHTDPRGDELPDEVDSLPNVRYFDGVRSGVFLRAALISSLWEAWGHDLGPSAATPQSGRGVYQDELEPRGGDHG
jgi:aspartate carbamoyltransferase catalytic subunit